MDNESADMKWGLSKKKIDNVTFLLFLSTIILEKDFFNI